MDYAATFGITQAAHSLGSMALVFLALVLLFASLMLALTAFWVWMLVDCANSPLDTGSKTAWILILLFTHLLGAVLYFFIPRRERLQAARAASVRAASPSPFTTC